MDYKNNKFITFHRRDKCISLNINYISFFKDYEVWESRATGYVHEVDETHDEILELINKAIEE